MERKDFLEKDYRIVVSDIIKQMIQKRMKLDKSEVLFYGFGESQDEVFNLYLKDIIEEFIRYDVKVVIYCKSIKEGEFEENKNVSLFFSYNDLMSEREQVEDHRLPFRKQCFNVLINLLKDSKEDYLRVNKFICNDSIKLEL